MPDEKKDYSALFEDKKIRYPFLILFATISITLLYIYRYYFWPFFFALIIYIAIRPFYDFITGYLKSRLLSSLLMVFTLFLIVLVPLFFVLISLADQAYELYLYLQEQFNTGIIEDIISENIIIQNILSYFNIEKGNILNQIIDLISKTSFKVFSNITTILTFSIQLTVSIFFMLIILFFLLKDGNRLDDSIYKILPFPEDIEKDVITRLKIVINILLAGNLLIMLSQGFVVGFVFYIFDVRMPLLWASVTAVLSLIPIIGTSLVWLPVVIYFLFSKAYISAILIGLLCLIGYLILENLVKPIIFGDRLNFHPLIFFFLLLGSIQAFNLAGVIIGPIILTLFYSFFEIYKLFNEYTFINEIKENGHET